MPETPSPGCCALVMIHTVFDDVLAGKEYASFSRINLYSTCFPGPSFGGDTDGLQASILARHASALTGH